MYNTLIKISEELKNNNIVKSCIKCMEEVEDKADDLEWEGKSAQARKLVNNTKESNMPLHTFIKEVISFVSICSSMLAYYTDEKYFTSRSIYDLPEFIKREIYNYMESVKKSVNTNIGTDSEGNTYNSITYNNVIC